MIDALALSGDDRRLLFHQAAQEMGVDPVLVEKDFWVCVALWVLFSEKTPARLIFKGGTSLSKAYNLIQRLSEDIDLTLDREDLGIHLTYEEIKTQSKKSRTRLLKDLQQTCGEFVKSRLKPFLEEALSKILQEPFQMTVSEEDPQSLRFVYPQTLGQQHAYIAQSVYMEFGIRGDLEPASDCRVQPYATQVINSLKNTFFTVRALSPTRTFLEKMTLLYAETQRPPEKITPLRLSRHWCDLHDLMKRGIHEEAFRDTALLCEVIHNKSLMFPSSWISYEEIFKTGVCLVPSVSRIQDLKHDYEQTKIMLFGEIPSFEDLQASIQNLEIFANQKI